MPRLVYVSVIALFLSPCALHAVSENTDSADLVVVEKVDRDERGVSMEESLRREDARRAEAVKKAEKIRNLPPERVQDWISGKLSEEDLDRLSSEPRKQEPEVLLDVPRSRLNRLLLVGAAVLILSFFFGWQRRRARAVTLKKKKR